jgi:cytochrome c-type biogenesis protein CcmE
MSTDICEPGAQSGEGESLRRRRWPWSFLLAGLVIAVAVAYLVYANTRSNAAYDLTVTQLLQCSSCAAQAVRVEGVVQRGSIQHDETTQQLSFIISDGQQSLAVVYAGVVPDIFNVGIQVVVEGHYRGQGSFQALTLLTKCPSKFTAATAVP